MHLTLKGPTDNINVVLDHLFSCYFTVNFNQTRSDRNNQSFAYDYFKHGSSPIDMKEQVEQSLTRIYGKQFGERDVLVTVTLHEDIQFYSLDLEVTVKKDEKIYHLKKAIEKIDSRFKTVDEAKNKMRISNGN